ncbi:hypothetical protein KIPB_004870 [Kipferlia bialata]|uniref:Uncharacterized protein n=1 Tax=Kipferlia bialata TaxID=797122 RepID=A0A9K3CUG1_9EUKA|nr:hypothetical protein KIPB_004870 [Kipferlia bialata]|eukprot:g4870.t1
MSRFEVTSAFLEASPVALVMPPPSPSSSSVLVSVANVAGVEDIFQMYELRTGIGSTPSLRRLPLALPPLPIHPTGLCHPSRSQAVLAGEDGSLILLSVSLSRDDSPSSVRATSLSKLPSPIGPMAANRHNGRVAVPAGDMSLSLFSPAMQIQHRIPAVSGSPISATEWIGVAMVAVGSLAGTLRVFDAANTVATGIRECVYECHFPESVLSLCVLDAKTDDTPGDLLVGLCDGSIHLVDTQAQAQESRCIFSPSQPGCVTGSDAPLQAGGISSLCVLNGSVVASTLNGRVLSIPLSPVYTAPMADMAESNPDTPMCLSLVGTVASAPPPSGCVSLASSPCAFLTGVAQVQPFNGYGAVYMAAGPDMRAVIVCSQ